MSVKRYTKAFTLLCLINITAINLSATPVPWQQVAATVKTMTQRSAKAALYAAPILISFMSGFYDGKTHVAVEKQSPKVLHPYK